MMKDMKKIAAGILFLLLGLVIFYLLLVRAGISETLETIVMFGVIPLASFIFISLINFGLYTYRWMVILNDGEPKEKRIGFWRLYKHRMSGYAAMYLLPLSFVGSEPIRVGLLAEDGVPLDRATSSVIIDIAFELVAFILFVTAGIILALVEDVSLGNSMVLFTVSVGIMIVFLASFYWATISGKGFFRSIFRWLRLNKIKRLHKLDAWLVGMEQQMTTFLGKKPWLLVWLLFLSILMVSFKAFEQWFIAHFLGANLDFSQSFLTATIPGLAMLIPVPSGLGFLEAGNTAIFALLGVSINAVALVLIIRIRDLVFITIGIAHAAERIWKFGKEKISIPSSDY